MEPVYDIDEATRVFQRQTALSGGSIAVGGSASNAATQAPLLARVLAMAEQLVKATHGTADAVESIGDRLFGSRPISGQIGRTDAPDVPMPSARIEQLEAHLRQALRHAERAAGYISRIDGQIG